MENLHSQWAFNWMNSTSTFIFSVHSFFTMVRPPCSLLLLLNRCQTQFPTHQTLFVEPFCSKWLNQPAAARLLLWQWKQWLNRGTDWNNPSVCPLVPQTSCLTKLNPCWCWAFRPVSLRFCLSLFHPFSLSVFLAEPRSTLRVTGYWPNLFVFCCRQQCAQPLRGGGGGGEWGKELEKERGRT